MKKVVLAPGWNGGSYQIEGKQISFKKGRTYNDYSFKCCLYIDLGF